MSVLRHILVADQPSIRPHRDELVVWVGPAEPPVDHPGRGLARARTIIDAVDIIGVRPAELRLALEDPLAFLTELAGIERTAVARAA
jgi:hypothetical protein